MTRRSDNNSLLVIQLYTATFGRLSDRDINQINLFVTAQYVCYYKATDDPIDK